MLIPSLIVSLLLLSPPMLAKVEAPRSILTRLLGQTKGNFKISGCEKMQLNPADIFNSIKYKTSFSEKCDLQGEFAVKVFTPFPIAMKIKNLGDYKKIQGTGKILFGMDNPPKILAELTKAQLEGKQSIYFNAYYSGVIEPATTLKVKHGTENIKVEIYDKNFTKKKEEFTINLK